MTNNFVNENQPKLADAICNVQHIVPITVNMSEQKYTVILSKLRIRKSCTHNANYEQLT